MTVVQWWGINSLQYPVWASLAHDFLLVMATSVLNERAFLSAGIIMSKHRNRLKADIVEALQCLKYSEKHQKVGDGLGDAWDTLVKGSDCDDECVDSDDDSDMFVQMVDTL
ncbi:hypothetical protein AZE42_05410 [Rhizopogon vesiculosus]|uniref:HAT C-terminal dimerisation domain-containing protein n=1 Tax=Rhizopogon vesiculosus TaxID=180088 RepID=A0A1J8Q3C3_9AGAM|nr:hypothetical protein AZE42_05410 [Rhizopogon vesiculosus]